MSAVLACWIAVLVRASPAVASPDLQVIPDFPATSVVVTNSGRVAGVDRGTLHLWDGHTVTREDLGSTRKPSLLLSRDDALHLIFAESNPADYDQGRYLYQHVTAAGEVQPAQVVLRAKVNEASRVPRLAIGPGGRVSFLLYDRRERSRDTGRLRIRDPSSGVWSPEATFELLVDGEIPWTSDQPVGRSLAVVRPGKHFIQGRSSVVGYWAEMVTERGQQWRAFIEESTLGPRYHMTVQWEPSGDALWVVSAQDGATNRERFLSPASVGRGKVQAIRVHEGQADPPVVLWDAESREGLGVARWRLTTGPNGRLWWVALVDGLGAIRDGDSRGAHIYIASAGADETTWTRPRRLASRLPLDGPRMGHGRPFITERSIVVAGRSPQASSPATTTAMHVVSVPWGSQAPAPEIAPVVVERARGEIRVRPPEDADAYVALRMHPHGRGSLALSAADAKKLAQALRRRWLKANTGLGAVEADAFLMGGDGRIQLAFRLVQHSAPPTPDQLAAWNKGGTHPGPKPRGKPTGVTLELVEPVRVDLHLPDLEIARVQRSQSRAFD